MSFTTPVALLLLALVPFFVWYGMPRTPYRRGRDLLSLLVRLCIVVMLIFGVAGAQLVLAADALATLFLVDFSDSMGTAGREAALDFVRDALNSMGPDDQAGVILFGADALVERPLSPSRTLDQVYSTPVTLSTNIDRAVRLGLALFPPDTARRMVVLSDGLANAGDADAAARLAAASGVQIDFVSFERPPQPEVLIAHVHTPPTLDEGQVFDLSLTLESNVETAANVTVLAAGEVVHQETVDLRVGTQRFVLRLEAGTPGFTEFRVLVDPAVDTFYQNNALSTFSRIAGPPRVLLVRQDARESADLARALNATGISVDEIAPEELPTTLGPLGVYRSVVLVNVPASVLSPRRMELLQVYVRDLGGGLVVVGGPNSYGVGGYYETPLEEALPVEMRIRDQERLPELALVFAIDRSGSMGTRDPSGYTHLDLAKEAVIRSIGLLNASDSVGVLGFDTGAFWVVPLQEVTTPAALAAMVGTMTPGGGTSIFAAVEAVEAVLPSHDAPIKHVVLLTDGIANPAGVREIVTAMRESAGVTTSVVAIGHNYSRWIEDLALITGGRFHHTADVNTIPTIFTAETILAARSYIVEEEFFPAMGAPSPIMTGITGVPTLRGYVATSAKSTARAILTSPHDDPVLAAWQYGLGRAVAWTSDATTRWADNWVTWDDFARFWSQAVRWSITEGVSENVEVTVDQRAEQTFVRVDAMDQGGRYLNGLDLTARIVTPALLSQQVGLRQVAPGRYEGAFTPDAEGAYYIGVLGGAPNIDPEADEAAVIQQNAGWVLSYSPEYRHLQANPRQLERIAHLTEGRQLTEPAQAFDPSLIARRAVTAVWPWLLLAAAVLLPLDVAVRRLVITRSDLERVRAAISARIGGEAPAPQPVGVRAEQFDQLRSARARARAEAPVAPEAERPDAARSARRAESAAPSPPPQAARDSAEPAPAEATPESGTLAARLLRRRRDAQDDDDTPSDK